ASLGADRNGASRRPAGSVRRESSVREWAFEQVAVLARGDRRVDGDDLAPMLRPDVRGWGHGPLLHRSPLAYEPRLLGRSWEDHREHAAWPNESRQAARPVGGSDVAYSRVPRCRLRWRRPHHADRP